MGVELPGGIWRIRSAVCRSRHRLTIDGPPSIGQPQGTASTNSRVALLARSTGRPGSVLCRLTPGTYQFHLDHGPEYRDVRGTFQLASGATDSRTISLERIVDMSQHGWYAGDLCVGRALEDLPLAARADEIDVVCRLTDHSDPIPASARGRSLSRPMAFR